MKRFVFTVGDGMNRSKDFRCEWYSIPPDDEFRWVVALVVGPDPAAVSLIEKEEIFYYDNLVEMVINEGPNGECATNGGPWLVARVEEVEL